jgi:hypothetical protein
MAIPLDAAQGFRNPIFRLKNDTRQDRTLVPTLPRYSELIRVPVAGICYHFQFHFLTIFGAKLQKNTHLCKKNAKKFGQFKKKQYFCTRFRPKGRFATVP